MTGIYAIIGIVMLVFGILQIVLFFKLWGMTNDVGHRPNKKPNKKLSGNGLWELLLFIRLRGNRCASRKSRPTINMCVHKVILLGAHIQKDV